MPEDRTVGARLRRARDERGLSLRQIADATKLPIRSLEALERDQVAQLPAGIYRRAIVRAFASEVGLDPESTLRAFLVDNPDELPFPSDKTKAASAASPSAGADPPSGGARTIFRLFGAIVPIVAGVVYFGAYAPQRVRPADLARGAEATRAWQPEVVPVGGLGAAVDSRVRPVAMMITITSRCLLRVTADGREVSARVMEPGEQLELALNDDVVLSGDDAGAVQFSINGRAGRLLGPAGAPLDVRITRDDYDTFLLAH